MTCIERAVMERMEEGGKGEDEEVLGLVTFPG